MDSKKKTEIEAEIGKIYSCLSAIHALNPLRNDPSTNKVLKQLLLIKDSLVKMKSILKSNENKAKKN